MMEWFLERLKEPSSWRGLSMLLTAGGLAISPAHIEIILTSGFAIVGAIGAVSKDNRK